MPRESTTSLFFIFVLVTSVWLYTHFEQLKKKHTTGGGERIQLELGSISFSLSVIEAWLYKDEEKSRICVWYHRPFGNLVDVLGGAVARMQRCLKRVLLQELDRLVHGLFAYAAFFAQIVEQVACFQDAWYWKNKIKMKEIKSRRHWLPVKSNIMIKNILWATLFTIEQCDGIFDR